MLGTAPYACGAASRYTGPRHGRVQREELRQPWPVRSVGLETDLPRSIGRTSLTMPLFSRPTPIRRGLRIVAAAMALALCTAAAPVSHADDTTAGADIVLFEFTPGTLDIPAGTSVTWLNHDAIVHSVTEGAPDAPGALFDSGLFDQNQTFTFAFTDPGQYTYFCTRHNFMRGTINVT